MVSLNLVPKPHGNAEDAARRREWLDSIGAVLGRVLGSEARMWLITTLTSLEFGDRGRQVLADCFLDLLQNSMRESAQRRRKKGYGPLELEFMRMIFEIGPRHAQKLIEYDFDMFRRLFSGHPNRIRDFFDHFAGVGQTEHLLGARALANFAFRNRDLYWHRLVWHGTHAHSPATVAAKPHYFMELDVVNTVQNFLESVPEFWESQEFRQSLEGGVLWNTDKAFFSEYLADLLAMELDSYTYKAEDTWAIVQDFMSNTEFSTLCRHLLHLASDETLLKFVNALGSRFAGLKDSHTRKAARKINWFGVMVYDAVQWESLMEPTFCNACIENGRKISRILQEEEHEEDANTLKQLLNDDSGDDEGKGHWALRDEIAMMDKPTACRYLALEAWVLFYQLSSESAGAIFYDTLLEESGITHHRSCSFTKEKVSARSKKRRKSSSKRSRKIKHRRRESIDSEDSDDELTVLPKQEQGWLLSIDEFKSTWTKADLPEALTAIAVRAWLDWGDRLIIVLSLSKILAGIPQAMALQKNPANLEISPKIRPEIVSHTTQPPVKGELSVSFEAYNHADTELL